VGRDLNLVVDGNWKEKGLDSENGREAIWETDLEGEGIGFRGRIWKGTYMNSL